MRSGWQRDDTGGQKRARLLECAAGACYHGGEFDSR
jgi:hypothetical protein